MLYKIDINYPFSQYNQNQYPNPMEDVIEYLNEYVDFEHSDIYMEYKGGILFIYSTYYYRCYVMLGNSHIVLKTKNLIEIYMYEEDKFYITVSENVKNHTYSLEEVLTEITNIFNEILLNPLELSLKYRNKTNKEFLDIQLNTWNPPLK
jgi:hypothetical protein